MDNGAWPRIQEFYADLQQLATRWNHERLNGTLAVVQGTNPRTGRARVCLMCHTAGKTVTLRNLGLPIPKVLSIVWSYQLPPDMEIAVFEEDSMGKLVAKAGSGLPCPLRLIIGEILQLFGSHIRE